MPKEFQNINLQYLHLLFSGRLNRRNYLIGQLFIAVFLLIIKGLISVKDSLSIFIAYLLISIVLIFSVSLVVRRLHDIGYSGWWSILVYAINFVGIFLFFIGGNKETNRYGKPPNAHINIGEDIFLKSHIIKV